jgi:hypothetical protein
MASIAIAFAPSGPAHEAAFAIVLISLLFDKCLLIAGIGECPTRCHRNSRNGARLRGKALLLLARFPEIEFAEPQPEQNKQYSESVDFPVGFGPVGAFEPEARHAGQYENGTDDLFYFHVATIAQIPSSEFRRFSGNPANPTAS